MAAMEEGKGGAHWALTRKHVEYNGRTDAIAS